MSMIIETKSRNIQSQGVTQQQSCSIDQTDMRYIASLLRNNYSNPLLATIREIVSNALDVTKSKKVEVQLPTKIEPSFIVRDYGCGLSEEDMLGLYTKYGKSTKRDSNDSIGGYGIGRFAPLSYTDSFIVRSVHQGRKHSYIVRVDENDDTIVSQVESKIDTESRDGVFVQVGIKQENILEFFLIFKKTFWYRRDSIRLLNESWGNLKKNQTPESNEIFDLYPQSTYRVVSSLSSANVLQYSDKPYVLMGGIPYAVTQNDEWPMFKAGVVYKANIGEFKLHHSRELLEYNPKVKEALKKASQKICDKLNTELSVQMESAKNFYEASVTANKAMKVYQPRFRRKVAISSSKFQNVTGELFPSDWIEKQTYVSLNDSGKLSFRSPKYYHGACAPKADIIYVVDDAPTPRSPRSRCMFLYEWQKEEKNSSDTSIALISPTDESFKDCVKRVKECDHPQVKLLSNCERIINTRQKKTKSTGRSLSAMDILKFGRQNPYTSIEHSNQDGWWGIDVDADLDDDKKTYYYVRYNANKVRFKPRASYEDKDLHPREFFGCWLNQISDFVNQTTIWGVRSKSLSKIEKKKNWICLDDVYEDLLFSDKIVEKYVQFYEEYDLFTDYNLSIMNDLDKLPKDTMNKDLKNLLKSYMNWIETKEVIKDANYNHNYVIERLKDRNLSAESSARKEAFDKAFPMVKYVIHGNRYARTSKQKISDVLSYIGK